jgi:hypothetical protein
MDETDKTEENESSRKIRPWIIAVAVVLVMG